VAEIQAKERSTTQRRGSAWNPRGGKKSFCQSIFFLPSLAHYTAAHALSTSSGAGLRGRSTISAVHPKTFSTQPLPLSSPL
jgi:hypothetical protein